MGGKVGSLLQNCIICCVFSFSYASMPHIIFILADDLGWNDVSFHGSDQIPTPNIDSLAYNGVILNRHYSQPVCTPSRAALMTGKYPIHTGMHDPLFPSEKKGLPLNEKILPQYLKELGYSTHIVGKWHLGFYKREFTPLERGFDSHFGYYTGAISYHDHICEDIFTTGPGIPVFNGHDMKHNHSEAWEVLGQYATELFTNEAVELIKRHNRETPMFLYIPHLAVHAGNRGKLLEAPQEEINKFTHITDPNRRTYAAMVSKLDQSVGDVIKALHSRAMLENTIVVFTSDNGAQCRGTFTNWGSNFPFRSHKGTLWEGGVRVPALVWSPLISQPSRVSNDLMHISDWLPTLLAAAGYDTNKLNIDGVNQWPAISNRLASPRENLIIDIHERYDKNAIIVGSFKYIRGATSFRHPPHVSGYLNLDSIVSKNTPYELDNILASETWSILEKYTNKKHNLEEVNLLRNEAVVSCGEGFHHDRTSIMDCGQYNPCLFDILTDPCESENLVGRFPMLAEYLEEVLGMHKSDIYPENGIFLDPQSDPDLFNGTWNVWVS